MGTGIDSVSIIGLGRVGFEIAKDFSKSGVTVYGIDTNPRRRAALADLIDVFEDIKNVPRNINAVIELVPELPELKRQVLTEVSRHVCDTTRIWMGSSMLPSSMFAGLFTNPHRVMNTHFLPDLESRKFVELQGSADTPRVRQEMDQVSAILERLGYDVARVNGESPGFLFNNIWHEVMYRVFDLLDEGIAPQTIDKSLCQSLGILYGPCMCMDLIGFKTLKNVFSIIAASNPEKPAPALVSTFLTEEKHGLESGQGFYDYPSNNIAALHDRARALAADETVEISEHATTVLVAAIMERVAALIEAGQDTSQVRRVIRRDES